MKTHFGVLCAVLIWSAAGVAAEESAEVVLRSQMEVRDFVAPVARTHSGVCPVASQAARCGRLRRVEVGWRLIATDQGLCFLEQSRIADVRHMETEDGRFEVPEVEVRRDVILCPTGEGQIKTNL